MTNVYIHITYIIQVYDQYIHTYILNKGALYIKVYYYVLSLGVRPAPRQSLHRDVEGLPPLVRDLSVYIYIYIYI